MNTPTPITAAHLALVRDMAAQGRYLSCSIEHYAQEIADSEARATAALRAEVERLKAESEAEDRMATTTINQRDRAEDAADKLASAILGEDIDWSDHDAKWAEALDEAECVHDLKVSLSEMIKQSRVDSSVAGIAICNEIGAIARAERAEAGLAKERAYVSALEDQLDSAGLAIARNHHEHHTPHRRSVERLV
jgi:uncharacterized protein YbjQ (UPF0145 family)